MTSDRDLRNSNRNNQASGTSSSSSETSHSTVAAAQELVQTTNVISESRIASMIQNALEAQMLAITELFRQGNISAASPGMNTPVQETLDVATTSSQDHQDSSPSNHRSEIANLRLDYDTTRTPYSQYHGNTVPPDQRLVNQKAYKYLQDVHYKAVLSIKLHGGSTDIQRKVDNFKAILNSADLLHILDGRRKRPIQTDENPNGYTPRKTWILNDPTSIMMEDDMYFYMHDEKKVFSLVMIFFDESLHFHCPDDIKKEDGITVFTKILAKIKGQALRDIDTAQTVIDNFQINSNKPIPAELCRLEECILVLEHAQGEKIPDGRKKNMVIKLILRDPRHLFHTTVTQDHQTYQSLRDSICHLYDNLPSSHQTVRMAQMKDTPGPPQVKKQICFKHQRGECTKGDNCFYSHESADKVPVPPKEGKREHKKRENGKQDNPKPPINKHSDRQPKFDFSNLNLPEKVKRMIGPPNGVTINGDIAVTRDTRSRPFSLSSLWMPRRLSGANRKSSL